MNARLEQQYANIELQNRERFLQNDVEIDTMWGKPTFGVTLQIDLSEEVRDQLCIYQELLDQREPGNLPLLPWQYQHLSFNQVVFWGGQYSRGTEQTWNDVADAFRDAFSKQSNVHDAFTIRFSKLIATTAGIIWCGYDDNDELEKLREQFFSELPFPAETTKKNHIIHTTVARFKNKLNDPSRVLALIQQQHESVQMEVQRITLRKELIFPSIKTADLASVDLETLHKA